jgi:hypothetical protein
MTKIKIVEQSHSPQRAANRTGAPDKIKISEEMIRAGRTLLVSFPEDVLSPRTAGLCSAVSDIFRGGPPAEVLSFAKIPNRKRQSNRNRRGAAIRIPQDGEVVNQKTSCPWSRLFFGCGAVRPLFICAGCAARDVIKDQAPRFGSGLWIVGIFPV